MGSRPVAGPQREVCTGGSHPLFAENVKVPLGSWHREGGCGESLDGSVCTSQSAWAEGSGHCPLQLLCRTHVGVPPVLAHLLCQQAHYFTKAESVMGSVPGIERKEPPTVPALRCCLAQQRGKSPGKETRLFQRLRVLTANPQARPFIGDRVFPTQPS